MPSRAPAAPKAGPLADEIRRLLAGEHSDPHQLLGAHPSGDHTTIRGYRPGAVAMYVLVNGRDAIPMERINTAGVFAADVDGEVEAYRLRVEYEGDLSFDIDDP